MHKIDTPSAASVIVIDSLLFCCSHVLFVAVCSGAAAMHYIDCNSAYRLQ